MKSSKVLVLPSTREGFGIVVIEANACGIPVVVVDHEMNAAMDLVHNGENGFKTKLSPVDMADNIIKSIERTGENKEKYIELSAEYDWNNIVDSLEKVYEKVS